MNTVTRLLLLASPLLLEACSVEPEKKNILFLCIDDLRMEVGAYGYSQAITPNMDALASQGSLFTHHYAQVPTSGASRCSMLTGRLPRAFPDADNGACQYRMTGKPETENPESFIHHLRRNGYYTVGVSKISHCPDGRVYGHNDPVSDIFEMPHSWNEMLFDCGIWETGMKARFGYADGSCRQSKRNKAKPYECGNVGDEGYVDGLNTRLAIEKLRQLSKSRQPFCLAVGIMRPHLPFVAPKKYWDLYDEDTVTLPAIPRIPENVNPASLHNSSEFKIYAGGEEKPFLDKPVSDAYARKLRHAYLACVSYADALVGKILDELHRLDLDQNTIVVLWGDHGWHLGEMNVWGKHTMMETSLNSPLIFRVPGKKAGIVNRRIVSSVDIYPTLMELCGVALPDSLDGRSFVPLLDHPDDPDWEDIAYGYWKRGITVRTPEYRYTRYFRKAEPVEELFEYSSGRYETRNIAQDHPEILEKMRPIWEKGNTGIFRSPAK